MANTNQHPSEMTANTHQEMSGLTSSTRQNVSLHRMIAKLVMNPPAGDDLVEMLSSMTLPTTWRSDKKWQYSLLFEWTWPRHSERALDFHVSGSVVVGMNEWVIGHRYDMYERRTRRHWFPSHLFDELMRRLPLRLDMDSWVGESLYDQHFYSHDDVEEFLIYISRIILDQLAVHLCRVYDSIVDRNDAWRPMLRYQDFRKAAREIVGESFTRLDFDEYLVLGEGNDLSDLGLQALQHFNTGGDMDESGNQLTAAEEVVGTSPRCSSSGSDGEAHIEGSFRHGSVPSSSTLPSMTRTPSSRLSSSSSNPRTPDSVKQTYAIESADLAEVNRRLSVVGE